MRMVFQLNNCEELGKMSVECEEGEEFVEKYRE